MRCAAGSRSTPPRRLLPPALLHRALLHRARRTASDTDAFPSSRSPSRVSKILVTGGAGFIGSNFVRMLLLAKDEEHHIVNVDALTYAGNLENLRDVEKH